jgi:ferric-dicitrate binding protein FerR (iron transport regulator)
MDIMNLLESIKIGHLIGKYLTGKESNEELGHLKAWINESNDHYKLFNSLKEGKNIADSMDEFGTFNKERAWKRYMARIEILSIRKKLTLWKVAAVFFFLNKGNVSPLAINNTYTTVSTNNGQNSKVLLPDSSVVWINSGTTLSYNTNFAVSDRTVILTGQAFFQIAKNEQIPLTVKCNELNVKVLGTRFDVSAYPEERNISIVLESGSVELLDTKDKTFAQMLNPGEKAEYNIERNELSISVVDSYNYTSWKDGILIFRDEPMENVFAKLERWYNIDIEVKNEKVNQLIFNATIVNESMGEIFDLIKFSCAISYTIINSKNPKIPMKVIITK